MRLLLSQPLWLAVLLITIAVHLGFALAIRHLIRKDRERAKGSDETVGRGPEDDEPRR
ncbi:MAG: hypothetical protein U0269_22910 [Polyangiales bacterium]